MLQKYIFTFSTFLLTSHFEIIPFFFFFNKNFTLKSTRGKINFKK